MRFNIGKSAWRYLLLGGGLGVFAYGATFQKAASPADPVGALLAEIQSGQLKLAYEPKHGYLKAVLKELNVPWSSQTLVFSKTSMQGTHVSPRKPRAIYFNDQVYVGWVNGGELIEIGSVDSKQGTHFYTILNTDKVKLTSEKNPSACVACHGGRSERNIPRLIVRSVYADNQGYPILTAGGRLTTPRTPIEDRWGGWYVSGTHGPLRHMGNTTATGDDIESAIDRNAGANKTDLKPYFDTSEYLTPHSDIVALMVSEHQMDFQNRVARVLMAADGLGSEVTPAIRSRLGYLCDSVVSSLLGLSDLPLRAPVKGTSSFAKDYVEAGVRDGKGRSLRELDLQTRIYKYRCSPMIYSPVFTGMPAVAKTIILEKMSHIVSGKDTSGDYSSLTQSERETLREILRSTIPEFAAIDR